jgi:hypothetical protein
VRNQIGRDVARQATTVGGTLFQAGMTVAASATIQGVVDEGPRSLVKPALYTFTIWALILAVSLAYAVYQALPAKRESPLLRRVGPFAAAACLVSLTGAGVRDPRDEPKLVDRVIGSLLKLVQKDLMEDSLGQARVIKESDLEWVIVRAPMLNEGEKKGEYRVGYVGKDSGTKLSRTDVADFMLKQIADDTYLHQAPVVSY